MSTRRFQPALFCLESRLVPAGFEIQGTILRVTGTAAADTFQFSTEPPFRDDPGRHFVTLNGESRSYSGAIVSAVTFEDGGGADSATIVTIGRREDLATFGPSTANVRGQSYSVSVFNVPTIVVFGGSPLGIEDRAVFTGSPTGGTFLGTPTQSTYYGPGFSNTITGGGFGTVTVTAGTSCDLAVLRDSPGNDTLTAVPGYATFRDLYHTISVSGFGEVQATSTGGNDFALLQGSAGKETLTAVPGYVNFRNSSFAISASGFREVLAISGGGDDAANLFDSVGADSFTGVGGYATMNYAQGRSIATSGFSSVQAVFSRGGADRAYLFGTAGNDSFSWIPVQTSMIGAGYRNEVYGAAEIAANVGGIYGGGTDRATFYGSDVTAHASANQLTLLSSTQQVQLTGFTVISLYGRGGQNTLFIGLPLTYTLIVEGFRYG